MLTLLANQTANGAGSWKLVRGVTLVMVRGDSVMDGATVTLEVATTETNGHASPLDEVFTTVTSKVFDFAGRADDVYIRAVVSGAGGSTDITVEALQ